MPSPSGPIVTISNGQAQREVSQISIAVSYDAAGNPLFTITAFGTVRLRDATGTIVAEKDQKQFASFHDTQIPAQIKTALTAIVNKLDVVP